VSPTEHSAAEPGRPARPFRAWLLGGTALLLLNAALTFDNAWPTAWPRPALALSIEALLLAALLGIAGRARGWALAVFAMVASALSLLHYVDVTLPALFGRPLSLYWDGRHLPGVMRLTLEHWSPGRLLATSLATLAGLALLLAGFALIGRCWLAALATLPRQHRLRTLATLVLSSACGLALLWPDPGPTDRDLHTPLAVAQSLITEPVTQKAWHQIHFALDAAQPDRVSRRLPSGPVFEGAVGHAVGPDVLLIFLESYGAVTWDNPAFRARLAERRRAFGTAIEAADAQVVSAFVRSPTFAGGSWLAHGSLLSGIDLQDPARYALLMTTQRPTLITHMKSIGYQTTGLMPGLRSDWAEAAFYRFDRLLDARRIDYPGPDFGFWRIPDQAAIAHWLAMRRQDAQDRPQFLVFPTITSHIPFAPVPPYQPDWTRLASPQAFAPADVQASLARQANWSDPTPAYLDAMDYSLQWLTGLVEQVLPRGTVVIIVGDHQPAARVSGREAPWDVPVHIIIQGRDQAARLVSEGFRPGLTPARPVLGAMHELTPMLIRLVNSD
jgi:hypothetical protein